MTANDLKDRTKQFAVDTFFFLRSIKYCDESKTIKNQLIRSSSSVAANYRAVCRARSDKEFYSKICIVVEEVDESQFWLEIIHATQECDSKKLHDLNKEAKELVNIFARSKKTIGDKLFKDK